MTQVDFIDIINKHCPVVFTTEYLLQVLIYTYETEDAAILRKYMHNNLYRLEKKHFIKRLSPKSCRNAQFEQRLNLHAPIHMQPKRPNRPLHKHTDNQSMIKNHYNVLQEHIKLLKHKHNAFKKLNDKFDSFSTIINRKLKVLDAELYAKGIELNAVNEMMEAVKKSHVV